MLTNRKLLRVLHSTFTKSNYATRSSGPRHASTRRVDRIASLVSNGEGLSSGAVVEFNGFVRSVRRQKRVAFAAIGDGSCIAPLQVVLDPKQSERLQTGVGVSVKGKWKSSPQGKEQEHEVNAIEVQVHEHHDHVSYPLQKKKHSVDFLRTIPHLRVRTPFNSLLLRMRSDAIAHLTTYFSDKEFIQAQPPLITSSDCEGAGEVFNVSCSEHRLGSKVAQGQRKDFFKTPKYLTVSSQLHLEALALAVGKVWALSPTFRAEKSDTPRHLSEFYMLEAEISFLDSLGTLMDFTEEMIRHVVERLTKSRIGEELLSARETKHGQSIGGDSLTSETLSKRWERLLEQKWPRISFKDTLQLLQAKSEQDPGAFCSIPTVEKGLQQEHEKFLVQEVGNGSPIFVTDYPKRQKPFYMATNLSSIEGTPTVACFDLLVPELCEVVGGSIREYRLSELMASMKAKGLHVPSIDPAIPDPASLPDKSLGTREEEAMLQWYLDLRRYGSVPHGGFGLGFDRLLAYVAGVSNIRDMVTFPRWYGRCDC